MSKHIASLFLILATACSQGAPEPIASLQIPSLSDRTQYSDVRAQLLQAGWAPIPAKCGNGYICSEQFPELASTPDGDDSGLFASGSSRVRIYARPIADGLLVERIEHVP